MYEKIECVLFPNTAYSIFTENIFYRNGEHILFVEQVFPIQKKFLTFVEIFCGNGEGDVMSVLLLIETSTNLCSVAVGKGSEILFEKVNREGMMHATLVAPFVEEAMRFAENRGEKIEGVAISCGPGSYTGLRIGVSLAKGVCCGGGIPLIAVSTLDLLAFSLQKKNPQSWVCPMIDARRMEVYTALYDEKLERIHPIVAKIITEDSFQEELLSHPIVFGGNGAEKCSSVLHHPNASFDGEIEPLASEMNAMAQEKYQRGEFEDVAYFEPFYLKDFITTTPKNKVLAEVLEKKN